MGKYSVSLKKVVEDNSLGILLCAQARRGCLCHIAGCNRPWAYARRLQRVFRCRAYPVPRPRRDELYSSLDEDAAAASMERLMATEPVAVVITRSLECPDKLREYAQKYSVPILTSPDSTSGCMSTLISYLGVELAQRITRTACLSKSAARVS